MTGNPASLAPYQLLGHALDGDRRPIEAVQAVALLRAQLDALEVAAVRQMRQLGMPWATVGQALGVRRQSAEARFRHRLGPQPSQHHPAPAPAWADDDGADDDLADYAPPTGPRVAAVPRKRSKKGRRR